MKLNFCLKLQEIPLYCMLKIELTRLKHSTWFPESERVDLWVRLMPVFFMAFYSNYVYLRTVREFTRERD